MVSGSSADLRILFLCVDWKAPTVKASAPWFLSPASAGLLSFNRLAFFIFSRDPCLRKCFVRKFYLKNDIDNVM